MIDRRFEVGAAQISILGKSTITALPRWTTHELVRQLRNVGYQCAEWHSIKNMKSASQIRSGDIPIEFKDFVTSAHQSYVGERTLIDVGRSIISKPDQWSSLVASFVFLPHKTDSLDYIEQLQEVIGKKLPVVLYPTKDAHEDSGVNRSFGDKLFQPTQEVMDMWGVDTIEELIQIYPEKRYDGLCFDTTHSQKLGGIDLRKNSHALQLVLQHTKEVHIRPGALDMQSRYKQVNPLGDLRQLLAEDENAWYPQFLKAIAHMWKGGRVITEVQASAIEAIHAEQLGVNSKPMNTDTMLSYHTKIVDNLARYLNSTEV